VCAKKISNFRFPQVDYSVDSVKPHVETVMKCAFCWKRTVTS